MRRDPEHGQDMRRLRRLGRFVCVALVLAGEAAFLTTTLGIFTRPAHAQFFPFGGGGDDQYYRREREYRQAPRPRQPVQNYQRQQQQQQQQQGWFGIPGFGWGGDQRVPDYERDVPQQQRRTRPAKAEPTRPPAPPKKPDVEPTTHVVVIGDTMSEWLASGLEDAFADTPDIGVTRNSKIAASLLRNDSREADPLQAIRDALAAEKAEFVVVMTGVNDRHAIRERDKPKPAEKKPNDPEQPAIAEAEPDKPGGAMHTYEFRSDKWAEIYAKRIDDTIAVLKTKRVPVIWVGLPPVRGPRSRTDLSFLNDLYKDRAEKAGILYVDIWDGFMEESGDFSTYGPDVLGQVRRLRTNDGVNFTKAGARKLAHFVDREIKRLQQKATPVALPAPDETPSEVAPVTGPSGPAPRPVAGPVVPLTGAAATNESGLAGAARGSTASDSAAAKVLVRGEAQPSAQGRADDFSWTPVSANAAQDIAPPVEPAPPPAARAPAQQRARPAPPRRANPPQQRSEVQAPAAADRPSR